MNDSGNSTLNSVQIIINAASQASETIKRAGGVFQDSGISPDELINSFWGLSKRVENTAKVIQEDLDFTTLPDALLSTLRRVTNFKVQEVQIASGDFRNFDLLDEIVEASQEASLPLIGILDVRGRKKQSQEVIEQVALLSKHPIYSLQKDIDHVIDAISPLIVVKDILGKIGDRDVDIDSLHWEQLEELVEILLRKEGFDAQRTPRSGDGGVDIIATREDELTGFFKGIWQVKKYRKDRPVGIATIRELADSRTEMKATKGYIVTTSFLTTGALKRIKEDSSILGKKERDELEKWIARIINN